MKLPFHLPEAILSGSVFRGASLGLYVMLFLQALLAAGKQPAYATLAIPTLLIAVALARYIKPRNDLYAQALLLIELSAAILAVALIALHTPFPDLALPWLVGIAGIFPLALTTSIAIPAVAAISLAGVILGILCSPPTFTLFPAALATLFAGVSTTLLTRTLYPPIGTSGINGLDFNDHLASKAASSRPAWRHRMSMDIALRSALKRNELSVVYQPKVSMVDGSIKGFEALLRWNSAQYGDISPVEFIPVAERSGLVVPIGLWVLEQACKQFKLWREQYPECRELTISVNVSMRQLIHASFPDEVATVLKRTGAPPQGIELELTESLAMTQPATTLDNLTRLKNLGLRLALDDFGTGYSSLAHLRKLPLDVLKIDKAFVQGLDKNGSDLEIVRTILSLAQILNFETVAEGVETRENVVQLKEMGCHVAQGFAFSEAVNAEMAEDMLRSPRCFAVA